MRVLVACEWSNTVRDAFLSRGHDAYSCDLIGAEYPNENWRRHIKGDVRPLLKECWDLVIAHPPCTYLCNSGVCHLHTQEDRELKMIDAAIFFLECLQANSDKVCVENPVMHKYAQEIVAFGASQVIQPWMFGHPESKSTCLWLRGLPKLEPTNDVHEIMNNLPLKLRQRNHYLGSAGSKERSRTYRGIARAMAEQWG